MLAVHLGSSHCPSVSGSVGCLAAGSGQVPAAVLLTVLDTVGKVLGPQVEQLTSPPNSQTVKRHTVRVRRDGCTIPDPGQKRVTRCLDHEAPSRITHTVQIPHTFSHVLSLQDLDYCILSGAGAVFLIPVAVPLALFSCMSCLPNLEQYLLI